MGDPQHWDEVYGAKAEIETSWFATDFVPSEELITAARKPPATFLDLGAGRSHLCSRLADLGYRTTALDISEEALAQLHDDDSRVSIIAADVTTWKPKDRYDLIHDRAVFHFLTESADRASYRSMIDEALTPEGTLILGTFAENGPQACSGLPVTRWSSQQLADELGMRLVSQMHHEHTTPWGAVQPFSWVALTQKTSIASGA